MTRNEYLKLLVEGIHSTTIATIGADGHPQTRVIDMMLYDEQGVYFLTAKGKAFYAQLMEQGYIALSARRNASTLRKSLWSSTSTGVSTADGVRKSVPSRLSKRGFDHEPK